MPYFWQPVIADHILSVELDWLMRQPAMLLGLDPNGALYLTCPYTRIALLYLQPQIDGLKALHGPCKFK